MYNAIILGVALVAWFVFIFPPLVISRKTAAQVIRCILAGLVSFGLSGGFSQALLDLIR